MGERRLTLIRHAKSYWQFNALDDFTRPLNRRGLRDCREMPRYLQARLPAPEQVLASPAVRAVQTCQAVTDAFGLEASAVLFDDHLYLGAPPQILARVAKVAPELGHVAVIAHNPGLTELHNYLSGEDLDNMPTFGVSSMVFTAHDWRLPPRRGEVVDYFTPRDLLG